MASDSENFDSTMDSAGLSDFLLDKGISLEACNLLEEEDIDAEAFLELTETEIKGVVKKLGQVKKILKLQRTLPSSVSGSITSAGSHDEQGAESPFKATSPPPSRSQFSPPVLSPESSRSQFSPPFLSPESDDGASVASSASALTRKFAIPDTWRPSIMYCLQQPSLDEQQRALTPQIRNEIVRDMAVSMFSFQQKPNKAFISQAARSLVKKYPFLKDVGQNVSGYGSWEKKIIERIHNITSSTRKRQPSNDLESTPKAKRGRPKQASILSRYPPMKDVGDDDLVVSRNHAKLEKEMKEGRPRKEVILLLARETFSMRRIAVLAEQDTVTASELLREYKELNKPYVIEQEMELILMKRDAVKLALQDWKSKWIPAILEYGRNCRGNFLESAQKEYEGDAEKEEKVALYILCKVLPKKGVEDALLHIYEECKMTDDTNEVAIRHPLRSAPRIAGFSGDDLCQYFLYVESVTVTQVSSFSNAIMDWFCLFYVLNLEYSVKVKEVCLFFQEFVFQMPATTAYKRQKTGTYLTTTTDIQKYCL